MLGLVGIAQRWRSTLLGISARDRIRVDFRFATGLSMVRTAGLFWISC